MIDLLVIGGGPAGATAAGIAAARGLDVLLLEAQRHPRRHVGESLLPGILPILDELGALEEVEGAGFGRKTGTTHWSWGTTPRWDLWFADTDEYDHAWLVERARFDRILFEAARRKGADAREDAVALGAIEEDGRVVGARWRPRGGALQQTRARLVVDASGAAAVVTRDLAHREVIEGFRHQCLWAHWEGTGRLPPPRREQALFVAESTHWLWLFPFRDGRASVGVVLREGARPTEGYDELVRASALAEVLGDGRRVSEVSRERDWSYRVSPVAGPGWLACGDAAGFIDPVLSTGVFLGMHGGWLAGRTAAAITAGEGEAAALARYREKQTELFEDLLGMVRFYYQQNLSRDDYFWRSKEVLLERGARLKPQKAFLILTSGLVRNLAFDERRARQHQRALSGGAEPSPDDELGFVCLHFRHEVDPPAQLYLLLEPTDPSAPALFRTRSFDLNVIAPRYDNDPIREPALAPTLRHLHAAIDALDDSPTTLAAFWATRRRGVEEAVAALDDSLTLVRVFGE